MSKKDGKNKGRKQPRSSGNESLFDTDWHSDSMGNSMGFTNDLSLMGDPFGGTIMPAVDIMDEGGTFKILADIPGVEKKDIKIKVKENYLTISANKTSEHKKESKGFYSRERSTFGYHRMVSLPEGVKSGTAKAKFNNGTLEITIEKLDGKKGKTDYVKVE